MNLLTRFGLARSRFTIAAMIGLLVAGIGLYPNFPKREDPVIVIRTAVVSALFPGMAPERMENLVVIPIERKIRELAEVKDIRTLAGEGSLTIYVDLKDEVDNVDATWQRLRDKMGDVKIELPEGVVGPFVNSDFGDVAIATIAITGEGFSPRELKDVAEDFRKKLYQLSGISKVELLGVQDERVWLELDTRKLAAVGVQVNSLIKDLQGQNVVLPSGNINADGTRLLLETSGDFPNVHAIETMLTRVGTTDSLVRLADLVTVRRDYVSPKVKPIYFNGRPAVVLSVVMQPNQDVTQLGAKLRAASREYEGRLPIGYAIDFATYQADQVSASVNSALWSVAQTFIVVAVLVVLFLGARAGTVAAMIVPFAVMFSLIGMRALGIALEQVSIAASIIALGLLVDNGVVIVEDIVSRIGRGVAPQEAGLAMPIIRRPSSRSNGWRWEPSNRASWMWKSQAPTETGCLLALGKRVRSLLQAAPDVRENDDDWGNKIVKVVIEIDQDRARQLGVTSEEVTRLLNTYFSGTAVSIYREGDNAIPIVLRAVAYTSQSLEGLTSATFAKNGGLISLAQVARLKPGFDLARIRRKNQERTITVTARSTSMTAGQLLDSIQPGLQDLDLAGTYHVAIGGEIQKSAETNQKLAAGFPIALAVMVLAIILQFNSFRRTFLTFMSIPLILIGIPFGLLAAGQPLSFFGTLGIISLSGIIINNAIVLIDQIDIEREKLPLREAVVAASEKRLRPILLTSATTVLGLAPMAIAGGALWQPMAVLMMSGLAVASLLTLFFVPAGYFLLFWFDKDSSRHTRANPEC